MITINEINFWHVKNTRVLNGLNGEYDENLNTIFAKRGEGKTTLLDLILQLQKPVSGEILLAGKKINPKIAKKEIAVITADFFISENKSGIYNFENSKHKNSLNPEFVDLYLTSYFQGEAKNLSLVQRFQITLLRALRKCPSVLLLDDPFFFKSEKDRKNLYASLKEVLADYKKYHKKPLCTILFARPFDVGSDVVSILHGGKIIEKDSWENIQNAPKTTLVAVNFAKYPNNVFSSENKNFYIDAGKITSGENKCEILREEGDLVCVETAFGEVTMPISKTEDLGWQVAIDIPESAIVWLD